MNSGKIQQYFSLDNKIKEILLRWRGKSTLTSTSKFVFREDHGSLIYKERDEKRYTNIV